MTKDQKDLLDIIKSALMDTDFIFDDSINIEKVIDYAEKNKILPLVVHGLYKSGCNNSRFVEARNKTTGIAYFDAVQYSYVKKIQQIFEEKGIDYAFLKGSVLKNLYPSSVMRLMSDIDILIKEEQYDLIKQCMVSLGFNEDQITDHELKWKIKPGVVVELHKRLIPSYNDDYYEYYKKHWAKFQLKQTGKYEYIMTPEDEYIFLFTHMTKHYRDGGIGLRHIIDLWLYKKNNNLNLDYIKQELIKLKLNIFYENIISTIDVWFNEKENTEITDFITQRIIEFGSLNTKELMDAANAARNSARAETAAIAKKRNLIRLIFMPYSSMCVKYPFLKKMPFLLPVMWVVRWFDAVFNKRDNIKRQHERLSKIDDKTVTSYNEELKFVGLGFDLKKNK